MNSFIRETGVELKVKHIRFFIIEALYRVAAKVIKNAKDFSINCRVMGAVNRAKEVIVHPEMMVPIARRFKAFTSFLSSSLVGESGPNSGVFVKQNKIIRIEYTAVKSVAIKEVINLKNFDNFDREISKIISLE